MQHSLSEVVSVVEQRWNLLRKIANSVGMATRCSKVQGIASILQKGNAYRMYDSEATRHVQPTCTACRVGSARDYYIWGTT